MRSLLNILKSKRDMILYYLSLSIMILAFIRFELRVIDQLQVIFSEPILSGDIRISGPKDMLFGNEFFGMEKHLPPVLYLYVLGERFLLQITDYSIYYIPSIFLKISWKICGDIKCNRIASLILSVFLIILISFFVFKIYGFSSAIFGAWFSVIFMGYGIQPANSEMFGVNMCLLCSALTFWNLYLYHKTEERKYFKRSIIFSLFALNSHTLWGFVINFCTFLGFLNRRLIRAFKETSLNEFLKILILFVLLTFPLFISIGLDVKGPTDYRISFDIFSNLKNIYHHLILLAEQQIVSTFSLSILLFSTIITLLSANYRTKIENRAPFLSSLSLILMILLILAFLSEYGSISSTDLFLRAIKYVNFYTPFLLSSLISFILSYVKIKNNGLKLLLKLITNTIILLSLSYYTLSVYTLSVRGLEPDRPNNVDEVIVRNLENILGKNWISLQDQRNLVSYLLENDIYSLYAIVPPISAIGFIDILSKDKIKAKYISCIDKLNEKDLFSFLKKSLTKDLREKIFVVDHSCKDKIFLGYRYYFDPLHEIRRGGQTVYYIMKLQIKN